MLQVQKRQNLHYNVSKHFHSCDRPGFQVKLLFENFMKNCGRKNHKTIHQILRGEKIKHNKHDKHNIPAYKMCPSLSFSKVTFHNIAKMPILYFQDFIFQNILKLS